MSGDEEGDVESKRAKIKMEPATPARSSQRERRAPSRLESSL